MTLPFVLSIPHCGKNIPAELRPAMALSEREIAESVDFGTQEIFAGLPAVRTVAAQWNRLVVDLNRAPDQFDPKGVVALTDYEGRNVFQPGLDPESAEIDARVARYYRPYHQRLVDILQPDDFIGLLDCHSLNGTAPADAPDRGQQRSEVILSNFGDSQGRPRSPQAPLTCPAEVLQMAAAAFEEHGFSVSLNNPYRGGYIINHYGALLQARGRFAVQIEMNQDLYMSPPAIEVDGERIAHVTPRVAQALATWARKLAES
ncbi:MAG: hypothetical protein VR64_01080 [Desulfatitalea sp. BRH_c12]|nr:MAG: hypothetical protein VR64_01080 [Desulfatitalea sp. BRH_c12]